MVCVNFWPVLLHTIWSANLYLDSFYSVQVLAVKLAKALHQQWLTGVVQPQLLQMCVQ